MYFGFFFTKVISLLSPIGKGHIKMFFCYCDGIKVIYMYKLVYECHHIHAG